jgi:hypothetical protein
MYDEIVRFYNLLSDFSYVCDVGYSILSEKFRYRTDKCDFFYAIKIPNYLNFSI